MNEDYNFLKLELSFLKALDKEKEDIGNNLFQVDSFVLSEKHDIGIADFEALMRQIENQGVLQIVSEETLENDFIPNPIKRYKFSFDESKLEKLANNIDDRISGRITIRYDEPSSTLFVGDKKIEFTGKLAGSNQADLCKVLLKNPQSAGKKWFNDQVLKKWGYSDDDIEKKATRKVYDAANELNDKIANSSSGIIEQFFVAKLHEVSINPEYRSIIEF